MKMVFRGWGREVKTHEHEVAPVEYKGDYRVKQGRSLDWADPFTALGKVEDLSLSGSFLVEFEFDPRELRSWLQVYAKSEPAAALRLVSEANAEAVIALNHQGIEDGSRDT